MAEIWPASLPCAFLLQSLEHGLGDNLLRSETETGPGKVRPRASSAPEPLTGTMRMTTAQWQTLEDFFHDTLLEGSLVFALPLAGYESEPEVRFTDPPKRRRVAQGRWDVSLELEIMP